MCDGGKKLVFGLARAVDGGFVWVGVMGLMVVVLVVSAVASAAGLAVLSWSPCAGSAVVDCSCIRRSRWMMSWGWPCIWKLGRYDFFWGSGVCVCVCTRDLLGVILVRNVGKGLGGGVVWVLWVALLRFGFADVLGLGGADPGGLLVRRR